MQKNNSIHKTYLLHAAFWGFMYLFVLDYYLDDFWIGEAMWMTALEISCYALFAYLNYFLLIPTFLANKRYLLYGMSVSGLIGAGVLLFKFSGLGAFFYGGSSLRYDFSAALNLSLFTGIFTLFWYYEQWQINLRKQVELERETLQHELKFLKSQISPHFLFNSLNNIYSLTYQKDDAAAPMVMKLSQIMRYVLHDGSSELVPLQRELDFLQDYMALQQLKKRTSQNIDVYVEGIQTHHQIPPLLLIDFVENAFKYSDIEQNESAWINVSCVVEEEKLLFTVNNSKAAKYTSQQQTRSKEGGIGLSNAKRRLELHYPNRHELNVNDEQDAFEMELLVSL